MRFRRFFAFAAALALALGVQMFASSTANAAAPSCWNRGAELQPGSVLNPGECLQSGNGSYRLIMQKDGNLVLYVTSTGRACWASSWSNGGHYVAGDKMYFTTLTVGYVTDSKVRVMPQGAVFAIRYQVTYSDTRPPGVGRSYTASLNNYGEFWIGWDLHRKC